MMCDTNWCTFCDNAISPYSDSLYCSEECLRQDALMHHPMLGYDYADLKGFPHHHNSSTQQIYLQKEETLMPSLVRRKSSVPTMLSNLSTSSSQEYFTQMQKTPSLTPSLSSSISSSYCSTSNCEANKEAPLAATSYFHPKPRRIDQNPVPFMEQLNQALLRS